METDKTNIHQNQEEEEYVLLDLDAVCGQVDIPPDEPYCLSVSYKSLKTISNPLSRRNCLSSLCYCSPETLFKDRSNAVLETNEQSTSNFKIAGSRYTEPHIDHRQQAEVEKPSSVCEGSESVEANLSRGTLEADHNQNPSKLIMPVTSLHKILKFRLLPEADEQDLTGKPPDASSQKEHL